MSGYELPVGIEIFRGRYVDSFAKPRALKSGKAEHYRFGLPNVNHVFLSGHRIGVQVQSSLFPLYDRNPQTFVPTFSTRSPAITGRRPRAFPRRRDGQRFLLPIVPLGLLLEGFDRRSARTKAPATPPLAPIAARGNPERKRRHPLIRKCRSSRSGRC